jgi:hypothetical protein
MPSAALIFGIRILFDESLDRFEDIEWGVHPWIKRAKDADLEYRWDRTADEGKDSHALYIGAVLATVASQTEGQSPAAAFALDQFTTRCQQTVAKLDHAGLTKDFGQPAVWVQWYEDL